MNRKAQVWYTDFMVGILILTVMIVVYFQFVSNFSFESEGSLDDLTRDAKIISNSLMTQGYPLDWNSTNVSRIGIVDGDNRLNISRLSEFKSIDYNETKNIFSISSDYFIYFEKQDQKETLGGVEDIGVNETDPLKLAAITRIVFYDGSFYKMRILAWNN